MEIDQSPHGVMRDCYFRYLTIQLLSLGGIRMIIQIKEDYRFLLVRCQ